MLVKISIITLLTLSLDVFACWKVDASLAVDGETGKINQKFEHNKEYIFPMGPFILKMLIKSGKKTQTLNYVVQEKKGTVLSIVTQGTEEDIKVDESRDIFAKGEEGQPNSIITIKLTNI